LSVFLCVVLSCVGRGLASGWSPVQGVLPTVYRFTSKNPSTPQGKRGRLRKTEERMYSPLNMSRVITLENKFRVSEKRVLRKIFGPKRVEV
jgi:hypothetical protein